MELEYKECDLCDRKTSGPLYLACGTRYMVCQPCKTIVSKIMQASAEIGFHAGWDAHNTAIQSGGSCDSHEAYRSWIGRKSEVNP